MPKYETEAAQNKDEIAWFAQLLKSEGVKSYLEIGSRYGGSLWEIAKELPDGAKVVTVDLPGGFGARADGRAVLESCLETLRLVRGFDTHPIWGDSTDDAVIAQVRALGPFDAVFIDANHTLPYVTKDWKNYGPLAPIVAFHDINWKRPPEITKNRIDVPGLWESIKVGHVYEEIKLDGQDNGIGVLWRT